MGETDPDTAPSGVHPDEGSSGPASRAAPLPAEVRILQQASVDAAVATAPASPAGHLFATAGSAIAHRRRGGAGRGSGRRCRTRHPRRLSRHRCLGRVGMDRRPQPASRGSLRGPTCDVSVAARDGHGRPELRASRRAIGGSTRRAGSHRAGGHPGTPLAGLDLAYVIGRLATAIPITPGGVGVVETTMTAALVAQGMSAGPAAAIVLAWRLISRGSPSSSGLPSILRPGQAPVHSRPSRGRQRWGRRLGRRNDHGRAARILADGTACQVAPCGHP
jgi:Lysylphosphatidylglycerol synthase TM region